MYKLQRKSPSYNPGMYSYSLHFCASVYSVYRYFCVPVYTVAQFIQFKIYPVYEYYTCSSASTTSYQVQRYSHVRHKETQRKLKVSSVKCVSCIVVYRLRFLD